MAVKPFSHSWPRFAAVIKHVLDADTLFFLTREDGIVFGTGIPGERGPHVYHGKEGIGAPVRSGMLRSQDKGRPILSER